MKSRWSIILLHVLTSLWFGSTYQYYLTPNRMPNHKSSYRVIILNLFNKTTFLGLLRGRCPIQPNVICTRVSKFIALHFLLLYTKKKSRSKFDIAFLGRGSMYVDKCLNYLGNDCQRFHHVRKWQLTNDILSGNQTQDLWFFSTSASRTRL